MNFLERYKKGEHIAVWEEIDLIGDFSEDHPTYAEISAVVEETMKRIRHNIETLHRRLLEMDFRFVRPENAYVPPGANVDEQIVVLEEIVGSLPLVIKSWLQIVGSVDFCGSHPALASYYPTDSLVAESNYRPHDNAKSFPYYSDPLYMEPVEYIIDECRHTQKLIADGEISDNSPYRIMSPDYYRKANISGSHYYIPLQSRRVDVKLLYEPHKTTWIRYMRLAFEWGGFPGFHLYTSDDFKDWRVSQHVESIYSDTKIPYVELRKLSADLLPI